MVRRLAFPASPPPWYGLAGVGRGGWRVRKRGGRWSCHWMVGWCLGGRPGLARQPFASRIPYNVARAPVLINLNLYFKPYTTLNPA